LLPMAEQSLRQALTISQGDFSTFVTRPISGTLLLIAALMLFAGPIWRFFKARR